MHVTAEKRPAARSDWRERETIKVEEAAVVLGINRAAAYRAARSGELPAVRIGKRLIVPVPALRRLLGEIPNDHDPGDQAGAVEKPGVVPPNGQA
jgi:excisionase family DNA binding protein